MKPTFLYIKQHRITKKLYFGKTFKNPLKYKGSGTHWSRHCSKHGNDVETLWYCLFFEAEELTKFALQCSSLWNIVQSDQWLNLIIEDGLGGRGVEGVKRSAETRLKMSISAKARSHEVYLKAARNRSPEAYIKSADARRGAKRTKESIARMSGREISAETRSKISKALKTKPKETVKCPHCVKEGGIYAMKRYHFNNCKSKNEISF